VLIKTLQFILDIIFTPTEIELLLRRVSAEKIYNNCKKTTLSNKNEIFSVFKYKDIFIKDSIYELKNNKNKDAIRIFGEFLHQEILNYIEENIVKLDYRVIITFVPQHRSTYLDKGYNQARELAAAVAAASPNFLELRNLLIKTRKTKPQHEIKNRKQRLKNLKNAFKKIKEDVPTIKNKMIILIDDVATTGATLNEARQKLLSSGASKVICFTIAH